MTEKLLTSPSPTSPDPGDGVNRSNSTFSRTASTQTIKEICTRRTYEDPGIFCQGGGAGGRPGSSTYFTVYRGGPMVSLHIFQGRLTFSRRGGGVQMLISIETHITITCDFPGGSGSPNPPLDPHMDNVAFWHELAQTSLCGLLLSFETPNANRSIVLSD